MLAHVLNTHYQPWLQPVQPKFESAELYGGRDMAAEIASFENSRYPK